MMRGTVLVILLLAALCAAQKRRRQQSSKWDYRADAEKVNTKGCSNLTLVLDNWKFAIMTQVKDLLLNDHNTVLPDYGRIQPLSDALGDLYKEFNGLKERLGELTTKFETVETFVDDIRAGKVPVPPREVLEPQPQVPVLVAGPRQLGPRNKLVARRPIRKPGAHRPEGSNPPSHS